MWDRVVITIEIGVVDSDIMIIEVTTPVGMVQVIGKSFGWVACSTSVGRMSMGCGAVRLDAPASMP